MSIPRSLLAVDGVSLAYEEYGTGEAVVFVHGFPASSYSWRQVARTVAETRRCICFDLMGFGYSDKPRHEDYSLERQAELLLSALDEMGLRSVTLIGHSIGGGVCLSVMRRLGPEQELVSRLVLVNTVCYPQRLPWFMAALTIPVIPRLLMKLIPEVWGFRALENWMYHPKNGMSPGAMREYAERLRSPGAHEAMIEVAKRLVPRDVDALVASYASIRAPTLIIWGARDRVIPLAFGERLAGEIRGSTLLETDPCGHCPQEERPEEVVEALRKFLD